MLVPSPLSEVVPFSEEEKGPGGKSARSDLWLQLKML